MNTYSQIIYHIVFGTQNDKNTLTKDGRNYLYAYMSKILQAADCHVYQIGGTSNHVHIITHLHPTLSLASLIKDVKVASFAHIKTTNLFSAFSNWQDGYGAFTYSVKDYDYLIEYVKQQEKYHSKISFSEEYHALLQQHGIMCTEGCLV